MLGLELGLAARVGVSTVHHLTEAGVGCGPELVLGKGEGKAMDLCKCLVGLAASPPPCSARAMHAHAQSMQYLEGLAAVMRSLHAGLELLIENAPWGYGDARRPDARLAWITGVNGAGWDRGWGEGQGKVWDSNSGSCSVYGIRDGEKSGP